MKTELLLNEWASWGHGLSNCPVLLSELGKGLTNRSYLLNSNIGKLVLRINHPQSESLGINRQRESLILKKLNQLTEQKIGPEIIFQDSQYRYQIYRFIEGRLWTTEDLSRPKNQQRLKQTIEEYQQIQLPFKARDYHAYLTHYWQQLENRQLVSEELRSQWLAFIPGINKQDWAACLSHHDLTPGNIIETEQGIRIIDWEYAHLGHPDLDWASVTHEQGTLAADLLHWMSRLWHLVSEVS